MPSLTTGLKGAVGTGVLLRPWRVSVCSPCLTSDTEAVPLLVPPALGPLFRLQEILEGWGTHSK